MTVTQQTWLEGLQALVTNRLDLATLGSRRVAAILGDAPSTYATSPRLWNAAFTALGWEAEFVPLDVPVGRLPDVVQLLRAQETFLGGSVTTPYKAAIMPLLDDVDPMAARIGAVNVLARAADGRLTGYNTDGPAGVQALTQEVVPGRAPPLQRLSGAKALVMGSGGAAQALAVHLWEALGDGELLIANRTRPQAEGLVQRLAAMRPGRLAAIDDAGILRRAPEMDLVINATTKGQAGIRTLPDGRRATLEPYSALAPAAPAALPAMEVLADRAFLESWYRASAADIERNHAQSLALCARLPRETVCYDLIYAPLETVFLRHARWSGHRTLNGKAMNLAQAVTAFARHVCRAWLEAQGAATPEGHGRIAQAMAEAWAR